MGSHGELPATVPRGSHLHAAPTHAHVRGCQWDCSPHASWLSLPIPYLSIFIPSIPISPSPSLHPFSYSYATSLHPTSFHLCPSIPDLSILLPPSPDLYFHPSIFIHPIPIPPSTALRSPSLQFHPFIPIPPSSPHPHPFSHAIPGSQLTLTALWVAMAEAVGAVPAAVTAGTGHVLLAAALPRNHAQRHVRVPIAGTSIQRACWVTVTRCQERGASGVLAAGTRSCETGAVGTRSHRAGTSCGAGVPGHSRAQAVGDRMSERGCR